MAFERTQTKHRAPIPPVGTEQVIHGDTKTNQGKREGFVQRQVNKIMRFRRERAARKKTEAAAAAKKKAAAKKETPSFKKTESAIEKRRRRQREELKGI